MKPKSNPNEALVTELIQFFTDRTDLPKVKHGAANVTEPKQMVQTAIAQIQNNPHTSVVYQTAARRLYWYRKIILETDKNK